MDSFGRVLLIEHLDATGAAPDDARQHAAALRHAGCTVEGLVLGAGNADDLLFPAHARRAGPGFDVLADDAAGRQALAARVRASRPARVLWASAARGGGAASACLPPGVPAQWWPTGLAPATGECGTLAPLDGSFAPVAGSANESAATRRPLSLWDGPFALVPSRPGASTARALVDAFALAAGECDEVDLVVLDHPEPALAALARRAGIGQRVHFVGPAPREAEHAWLATAALVLLGGDQPLSGALVLRALAAGAPLLPVGTNAAPLAAWLGAQDLAWSAGATPDAAIVAAVARGEHVRVARERGREVAAAHDVRALAARLGAALRGELRRAA